MQNKKISKAHFLQILNRMYDLDMAFRQKYTSADS